MSKFDWYILGFASPFILAGLGFLLHWLKRFENVQRLYTKIIQEFLCDHHFEYTTDKPLELNPQYKSLTFFPKCTQCGKESKVALVAPDYYEHF